MTSQQNFRVDSFVGGLFGKAPCIIATTNEGNITLSGEQTIDTVAVVEGDRVLVNAQTNPVENGIYVVEQSAWNRAGDFDGNRDVVKGTMVTVELAAGGHEIYQVTSATPNIGVDSITIALFLASTVALDLQAVTDIGAVTTNEIEILNLVLTEAGIPAGPGIAKGRIWLKNETPAELWFTDDAGSHFQLAQGGSGGINNVIEDATPDLGGNLNCLDNEVQRAELVDYGIGSSSPASASGVLTLDMAVSNTFEVELTENVTSVVINNPPATGIYGELLIKFKQDTTGGWTVTGWPAAVNWPGGTAPTITTTATTGIDTIHLATWDFGTDYYGTVAQDFS
jgi:hypothetical protein